MGNSRIRGLETNSHLLCSLALGILLLCLQNTNLLSKADETEARWQCLLVPAASGPLNHASLQSSILRPQPLAPTPPHPSQGLKSGSKERPLLYDFQKHIPKIFLGLTQNQQQELQTCVLLIKFNHHLSAYNKSFICRGFSFALLVLTAVTFCIL